MEFTLLWSVLLAVLALYAVLWWEAKRGNALDCTRDLWDIALGAAIAGLAVGRVTSMILGGVNPIAHPGDILIVRSGVDTTAASIAALTVFGWLARKDLWATADALAAPVMAGLAGWHASCTMRDICAGTPGDLPWAITTPGGSVGRHPVEMYAAMLLIIAAVGLALWKRRVPKAGVVGSSALFVASLIRLITEPLRLSLGSGPWPWYLTATVIGAGVLVWRLRSEQPASLDR